MAVTLNLRRMPGWSPWRPGNRFRLLIDGESFVPAMLAAINAARQQILLEIYLVESGVLLNRFVDALTAAAQRGVEVAVLMDDFGSRGMDSSDRERLLQSGCRLAWYNPPQLLRMRRYLSRNHRKLLVVDAAVAYTGGMGITDSVDPDTPIEQSWHEAMLEIQGLVVQDWVALFTTVWNKWSAEQLTGRPPGASAFHPGCHGRVVASQPVAPGRISGCFARQSLAAHARIWMSTAYFIPPRRLRRVLRRMARRGRDVRLLLPGPVTDHPGVRYAGHRYYASLLRAGVRIFEYTPRFLHAKVLLVDDGVSIGSSNLDRWNLRRNLEANQETACPELARTVRAMFEDDFLLSREITRMDWAARTWRTRVIEWFWAQLDRLLDKDG